MWSFSPFHSPPKWGALLPFRISASRNGDWSTCSSILARPVGSELSPPRLVSVAMESLSFLHYGVLGRGGPIRDPIFTLFDETLTVFEISAWATRLTTAIGAVLICLLRKFEAMNKLMHCVLTRFSRKISSVWCTYSPPSKYRHLHPGHRKYLINYILKPPRLLLFHFIWPSFCTKCLHGFGLHRGAPTVGHCFGRASVAPWISAASHPP